MNGTFHKLCGWSGIGCLLLMVTGFVGLARFSPPSPALSADETATVILGHAATLPRSAGA